MLNLKKILAIILVLAVFASQYGTMFVFAEGTGAVSSADVEAPLETFTAGDYNYAVLSDSTVAIVKYLGSDQYVEIPSVIDGKTVTQLSEEAFAYNDSVVMVSIPESVENIENSVFYHCEKLEALALYCDFVSLGFTLAEGSNNLKSVYVHKDFDATRICSLFVNDFGVERSDEIKIYEFEDKEQIKEAFDATAAAYASVSQTDMVSEPATTTTVSTTSTTAATVTTAAFTTTATTTTVPTTTVPTITAPEITENTGNVLSVGAEIVDSGTCGDNVVWQLDDQGTLTISGTGEMSNWDYMIDYSPWHNYRHEVINVVIENGVTSIGLGSFYGCAELKFITIPKSITSIGTAAFGDYMDGGVTKKLDTIYYAGSSEEWKASVCYKNEILRYTPNLYCDGELTEFVVRAGTCGTGLTWELTNAGKLSITGSGSFELDEESGEDIYSIPWINPHFDYSYVRRVFIGKDVTALNEFCFSRCDLLTDIEVEEGNNYLCDIDGVLYNKDVTELICYPSARGGVFTVPDSVQVIGDYAFWNSNQLKSVALSSNTVEIGVNSFHGCDLIEEIVLPESLKRIHLMAFYSCASLKKIHIPSSVEYIGDSAFGYCFSLEKIEVAEENDKYEGLDGVLIDKENKEIICYPCAKSGSYIVPDGIIGIGYDAFYCSKLNSITLCDSLEYIGSYAFSWCESLKSVTIPDSVVSIDRYAFYCCTNLERVTLGNSLKSIGDDAFEYCESLKSIVIPDSVTSIGEWAFSDCESLTSATIGSSVEVIERYAFGWCDSLESVTIPESVTSIESSAFSSCYKIKDVYYGGSRAQWSDISISGGNDYIKNANIHYLKVECGDNLSWILKDGTLTISGSGEMYSYADGKAPWYSDRTNIEEIIIENGVTNIGAGAFAGCTSLTSVTIPAGVLSIGNGAFSNCDSLTDVKYTGVKAEWNEINIGSDNTPLTNAAIHYAPLGQGECGENLEWTLSNDGVLTISGTGEMDGWERPWNDLCDSINSVIVKEGVTSIGDGAFADCASITSISLPESLISIGAYSFANCSGITGILVIPDGVEIIGEGAFNYCTGLTGDIVIPNSVTELGAWAFADCTGLNGNIHLPETLTVISEGIFGGCINLTGDLYIPDTVESIGSWAFNGCSGLNGNLILRNGLETISYGAFDGCSALSGTLNLPETLITIDDYAFTKCAGFTGNLVIPDSVLILGSGAFSECAGFDGELTISENIKSISSCAFSDCIGLTGDINIPYGVEAIHGSAFVNCTGFDGELILPDTVKYIYDEAFANCSALTGNLIIPNSVTEICSWAFADCSSLDGNLYIPDGVMSIYAGAFCGCSSLTGDLIIPDSVINVGPWAFDHCSGLNGNIVLPKNITTIPECAFNACSGLVGTLTIPDAVKSIDRWAFCDLYGIEKIVIGKGISSLGGEDGYFSGLESVVSIEFKSEDVPGFVSNPFESTMALETVYVPYNSYSEYVDAYSEYVDESVEFTPVLTNTAVKNLKVNAVYSKSAVINWSANSQVTVDGYVVMRNGEEIARVTGLNYTDRALEAGKSYEYTIAGYNAANVLTELASVTVITQVPVITDIYTDFADDTIGRDVEKLYVKVKDNGNLIALDGDKTVCTLFYYGADGERIAIGDAELDSSASSSTVKVYTCSWNIADFESGKYNVIAVVKDVDGTAVELETEITIDKIRPAKLSVVTTGDIGKIHVSWTIAAEVDTEQYRIYRRSADEENFSLIATVNGRNKLTYTDVAVTSDHSYSYYVTGLNRFGIEGEPSNISESLCERDHEPPQVTKFSFANESYFTGTKSITAYAQDNIAVACVKIYISVDNGESWELLAEKQKAPYSCNLDTKNYPDGKILMRAVAYDAENNESNMLTYVCMIDNTGPEKVTGLAATCTSATITLSWEDVSDNDRSSFRVERKNSDGSYTNVTTESKTLGANLKNLAPETEYVYRVVCYDIHGNRGTPSDDISVTTLSDTTAPVVTDITPDRGAFAGKVNMSFTATDEYNVAAVKLQISRDRVEWTDFHTQKFSGVSKSRSFSYSLSVADMEEGYIYIRPIAIDAAGNNSDTSDDAPQVRYTVDRTAPSAPVNVKAEGFNGYIEVSWDKGSEEDLDRYSVYRSVYEYGSYSLMQSGMDKLNWFDRNAAEDTVYYYKVVVNDKAGNTSEYSSVVSAMVIPDTMAPTVSSVYPATGSTLGNGYKTLSITATDNQMLSSIKVEYRGQWQMYSTLREVTSINSYSKNFTLDVPITDFNHEDTVFIRVTAYDKSGNVSDSKVMEYTIDKEPPAVTAGFAVYDDASVSVNWSGEDPGDLLGYRVYRKTGTNGSYSRVAERQAVDGKTDYSWVDYALSIAKTTYYYKIEAVDKYGNTSYIVTDAVQIPDRSAPTPAISCDTAMEVGVDYYIDASMSKDNSAIVSYHFDFGDGTTSDQRNAVHKYTQTGEYRITLTVTDDDGNRSTCIKEIVVKERAMLGTAKIRIVDENGKAVSYAPVYFDLGEEYQVIKTTDKNGYVTFTAEVGKHTVGCVIADNEWLPVKKDIIVRAGEQTNVSMTLIHHVMIDGQFEITRMTLDEIKAAGIDVSKPENQFFVNVNVTLQYGKGTIQSSFKYNESTGKTIAVPTIVDSPDTNKKVQITPVVIYVPRDSESSGDDYNFSSEATIAFLETPIGASTLKEFFNVKLHIINNASSEFSMLDNLIELEVPQGLSLVKTDVSENSNSVSIAEIKGQTTETITWILRGDTAGEYYVSANYSGVLSEFDENISAKFVSTEPIVVHGLDAVKMIVNINNNIAYGGLYFDVGLYNKSDADVNLPSIEVIENTIKVYEMNAEGEIDPEEGTEKKLKLLNTLVKNSKGYVDYLEEDEILPVLLPGETYMKEYVCYNAITSADMAYLQKAVYEVADAYDIEVQLNWVEKDLYSVEDAGAKVERLLSNAEIYSVYRYILDNENFIYYVQASEDDEDFIKKAGEILYNATDFALNFDLEVFTNDRTKDTTRALICDMLVDEAFAEAVESNVDNKYFQISKSIISLISNMLPTDFPNGTYTGPYSRDEIISSLNSTSNIRTIATTFKNEGPDSAAERLLITIGSLGGDYCVAEIRRKIATSGNSFLTGFRNIANEETSKILKNTGRICEALNNAAVAWNESTEITNQLIQIDAAYEEAVFLLDMILQHPEINSVVYKEIQKIRTGLDEGFDSKIELFIKEFAVLAIGQIGSEHLKSYVIPLLLDHFMVHGSVSAASSIIALLKVAFGTFDYLFQWEESVDALVMLRVAGALTYAIRREAIVTGSNSVDELRALKYLTKIRLIGERAYVELSKNLGEEKAALRKINGLLGENFESLDAYYLYLKELILGYRDTIFGTVTTTDGRPGAPVVTIDYLNECTNESFDSSYEYSFNGGKWITCNGEKIALNPGAYGKHLTVRVKESALNLAGNTTKIFVPAKRVVSPDVIVRYIDGAYEISKLADGEYKFVFSDSKVTPDDFDDNFDLFTISDGVATVQAEKGYRYINISVPDTFSFPASTVIAEVAYPNSIVVNYDSSMGTATGSGEYFDGDVVTLTAEPNADCVFVGWYTGDTLISKDKIYPFYAEDDCTFEAKFFNAAQPVQPDNESPQPLGTEIKFTATGGSQYKFYYELDGEWVKISDVSDKNEAVWNPKEIGSYNIYVDVINADGNVSTIRTPYTITDPYAFTLDKANVQKVGVDMTLTATGGSSYKFYYEYNGGWGKITDSTTGICTWTPKFEGEYLLYVDIKDAEGNIITCRTQPFTLNDPFSVTCSEENSVIPYGKEIKFDAEGGTSYKFYYEKNGEWIRVQDFSETNTCTWTPTQAGRYNFYVDIKDESGTVVSCQRMSFDITNPYTFTADCESAQQIGTKINFSASGGMQYKFYYELDGTWVRIQNFSSANTCAWTPNKAGRYNVYVDIADANGKVIAYKGMEFVIGSVSENYSFTTSVESPQPMNTSVVLTAEGGTSYKFYYEIGGKWAVIQSFSASNTCTWTPDVIDTYTLYVDIKDANGKIVKTLTKNFVSDDPYSFTADAESTLDIGSDVTFTATGGISYKFYYQHRGAWVKIQDSSDSTCVWKPNKAGKYLVYVDVKDANGSVLACRTMELVFNDPYSFATEADSLTQTAGTPIGLTADGGVSYKFYYERDGAWVRVQNYSDANTCTWTPTQPGRYNFYCDIKDESGSVAVCKRITFNIAERFALIADRTVVETGESITFNATGGSQYKFYYESDGKWVRMQSFTDLDTFTWVPAKSGEYMVYVDVNDDNGNTIGCKGVQIKVY